MIFSILYLVLAILGLGFLVFIHELGHYIVARRVGMTVEAFSIGFGKPIHQWEVNGVKWQICWLPFGGYVKIAGMERKGSLEPYQIPDGFYGKRPWQRIKVALAGPVVNMVFAFVAFTIIWLSGGQEKPFQQYTNIIGSIEPQSQLYAQGVRPGDTIAAVDGKQVQGFPDLFMTLILNEKAATLNGSEINYATGQKEPYSYNVDPKTRGLSLIENLGIAPAQYLVFESFSSSMSPMKETGLQKGDRIVWANGEFAFSRENLSAAINEPKALLTVKRGGKTLLTRVPRVKVSDLKLDGAQKAEIDDWLHETELNTKLSQLYFIPYNLTNTAVVESSLGYLDQNAEETVHTAACRTPCDLPLEPGDQIIAVNGTPTSSSFDLLAKLQTQNALIIVQRSKEAAPPNWKAADAAFETSVDASQLAQITRTIGTPSLVSNAGDLYLLSPAPLVSLSDISLEPKVRESALKQYEAEKKAIEKIENAQERETRLKQLEQGQKRLILGIQLQDRLVAYNPTPVAQFIGIFEQTWKTLLNLVTGYISPKYLAGPVGIVQTLQYSWASGIKSALFWLGFVSMNLAFLNLLPIPVLDGGHILFSIIESVTKKPIKSKTMERLIIPFVVLLIVFIIYVTYHDLARLFGKFI
jgi:regulator of sigma E protease